MFQDQVQFGVLLHHRDDLPPDFLGQHHHLDVFIVLEAVADDGRLVIGDGQHREQLRLRSGFEAKLILAAVLEDFFHHLPLLIHLDRVDAAVTRLVVMLGDGVLKGLVHLAQPVLQNFAEADQDGQRDAAQLQVVDQLFEIDAARRVLVGAHPHVAVGPDREVAFAPTSDIVELAGLGDRPAVGRLANRCGLVGLNSCHEAFSVLRFDARRK